MRILYYSDAATRGGAEAYLLLLARGARDAGHVVAAALAPAAALDGVAAELRAAGVQVHRLPRIRTLRRPRPFLRQVGFFLRHRYDLIHFVQVDPWSCAAGILAAKVSGQGILVATSQLPSLVHPFPTPFRARIAPYLLRRLIVVGAAHRERLARNGRLDPRVRVIRNGIPLPPLPGPEARQRARRQLGLPPDAPVVGTVGRLTAQKNHRWLLLAAAELPGVHVVLVGAGPEGPALAREARTLGLTHRTHFPGARPRALELMPAFDVFCLTSRYEGLPLALLEAMALELPVVVPDRPEMREVVASPAEGVLVPPGEVGGLARALARLLADPEARRTLGRAARQRVAAHFRAERMVAETLALYDEVRR